MKNDTMKFSVSMSVYQKDNPEHFYTAIMSVVNQTVPPDEIVLVVDGPISQALECVIQKCQNEIPFLKTVRLKENMGHGIARNTGIENCSYNLVAIMDSDDISASNRFEKQLKCFEEQPELAVCGGNIAEFINEADKIVGVREVPQKDGEIKRYMKFRCPFNQVTVMFNKTIVMEAGGYQDWYCNEDYYLWIRLRQNGAFFQNIPESLVFVRAGEEMYQRRGGIRYFKSEAKLQIYMRRKHMTSFFTCFYNIAVRFVVQVLMTNKMRGCFFQKFARK